MNPGDDLLAGFEPGAGNNLLPHGERSVGHEQETHGGHADFGALADIGGQTDQDRMDLLEFILQLFKYIYLKIYKKTNLLGSGKDDAVEGEDGADALGGVVELAGSSADDGQQNGDNLLDAEGTESGQSDDAVNGTLGRFQFLDEQRQELFGDDGALAVAKVAQNSDGEALGGRETRAADRVQQIGDRHQSGLFHGLGGLNGAGLPQVLQII